MFTSAQSVDLVERPRIREAASEDLIDGSFGFLPRWTVWTALDSERRSPLDAVLMMARERPLSSEDLVQLPALATETRRSYLHAGQMSEIRPIDLEPPVIPRGQQRVGELIREGVSLLYVVGADGYAEVRMEDRAAARFGLTWYACDGYRQCAGRRGCRGVIGRWTIEQVEVAEHEPDYRACGTSDPSEGDVY